MLATPLSNGTNLDLLASYQAQICDLEWTVTGLRDQIESLNAALVESSRTHSHFQELFEYAPTGYVVHDCHGNISEINRAASAMLEFRPHHIPLVSLAQFVAKDEFSRWLQHMRQSAAHVRAASEFTLYGRHGRATPVQMVTIAAAPPARPATAFRTTLTDITERRAAEAALAQTQQDYHQLIDTIEGIVWEADPATREFLFVSRYAERLLGYPLSEWRRMDFWENHIYVDDRDRVLSQLARAIEARREIRLDYRVLTAERRLLWLHDSVTVVERGGRLKVLGVAIDITERVETEAKLRQAREELEQRVAERTAQLRQSVADLEAFSYSLSHDLRAPIRAIRAFAELLERTEGPKLEPRSIDFLHRIIHSSERLDLLVQDVLQYSRVARSPIVLKSIALEALVRNILHDYPSLGPSKARIEVQQPLAPVYGHEAFVGQALSNLLTNAVKFVPPGCIPHVRLRTAEVLYPRSDSHPGTAETEPWVRIWVEDNGLGIAPEDQKRIFHIFERVESADKYEGTGIGLAIVQKAVERMGGRLGVESEPGQGSKFWIELRRA